MAEPPLRAPRLGIYFDLRNPSPWRQPWAAHYARTIDVVTDAEALGCDSVWVSEHHLWEDGYLPQPLTFLAALAARTERVRLGTSILVPALRPAVQVAEEAAIVDVLSDGRLDLGLGVGWSRMEYEAFGADHARRRTLTRERIAEIRELLATTVVPPPVQDPLPLWGGFTGPNGARSAGRLGLGLLSLDRELFEAYVAGIVDAGGDPAAAHVAGNANVFVADDPDRAWDAILPHLAWQLDTYASYGAESDRRPRPAGVDTARLRSRRRGMLALSVLTPEQAAVRVAELTAGLPVRDVYVFATLPGLDPGLARRHVELWCTEVRDRVRSRWAQEAQTT